MVLISVMMRQQYIQIICDEIVALCVRKYELNEKTNYSTVRKGVKFTGTCARQSDRGKPFFCEYFLTTE